MATTELQERDRSRINDKYKWNIDEVYSSDAAWRAEKTRIAGAITGVRVFSCGFVYRIALADALDLTTSLEKDLSRLYVYASMLADQDTRVSEAQGMKQEMQLLFSEFAAQASYIEPENPEGRQRDRRNFFERRTAAQHLCVLSARHPPSRCAYAHRRRRKASRGCGPVGHVLRKYLRHSVERGLSLSDHNPGRRQKRSRRSIGLRRIQRCQTEATEMPPCPRSSPRLAGSAARWGRSWTETFSGRSSTRSRAATRPRSRHGSTDRTFRPRSIRVWSTA